MGLLKFRTKISVENYLEGEKHDSIKYEYFHGEVFFTLENFTDS
jgi:hypothetical protein